MVEPNPTNKERYSISFNTIIDYKGLMESRNGQVEDYNENEFLFDLDIKGNPIR